MNALIRLSHTGDGSEIEEGERAWCLKTNARGDYQTLCGEMYSFSGMGEGCMEFETKELSRGGVTCSKCLEIINICKKYRA